MLINCLRKVKVLGVKLNNELLNDRFIRRPLSTLWLKRLPALHLGPINLVIFQGPTPYLGIGFALICFQHLSIPSIATEQFSWY